MTIQGTFLQKDRTLVELQINAVRVVQKIHDSSSEGAFGILIGARLLESPREERSDRPPDDGMTPQTDTAEGSDCSGPEDMWIAFDAGTEGFVINDCSPGVCLDSELGLLRWAPPMARHGLETWVVDEVAACGQLGNMSSTVIEQFHLRVPAMPARSIVAEKAWLEVKPTEIDEDDQLSLPVVLWLRGVACQQRPCCSGGTRPTKHARLVKQQLTSILEDCDWDALGEPVEQQSVAGSEELTPSDSVSEQGLKFRIRLRGKVGPSGIPEGGAGEASGQLAEQRTAVGSDEPTPPGSSASNSTYEPTGIRPRRRD
jgi:hypothetical protein